MIPNSEAFGLDDPECCLDSLGGKRSNRAIEALNDGRDGLVTRPQNDHTRRATGIIPPRIREVSVERDEDPSLTFAGFLNRLVQRRPEPFFIYVMHVPPARDETLAGKSRHVLVELEPHELRGDRDYPLVGELRSECQRSRYVLGAESRVLL